MAIPNHIPMSTLTKSNSVTSSESLDSEPLVLKRKARMNGSAYKKMKLSTETSKHEYSGLEYCLNQQCIPVEYQKKLIDAIFQIGLTRSSPKVLMNLMPPFPSLTTENIKSRLQKCRSNKRNFQDSLEFCILDRDMYLSEFLLGTTAFSDSSAGTSIDGSVCLSEEFCWNDSIEFYHEPGTKPSGASSVLACDDLASYCAEADRLHRSDTATYSSSRPELSPLPDAYPTMEDLHSSQATLLYWSNLYKEFCDK